MVYNILGVVGVILILVAFFLLQIGRIKPTDVVYSLLNLLGAIGILISLIDEWNLSAFLIETAWVLISVYGLFKKT